MADSQVYDPTHDQPLAVGERVRIVKAHRTGSELFSWERRLAGRSGRITGIFQRSAPAQDAYLSIAVALDPLTPRQRTEHSADPFQTFASRRGSSAVNSPGNISHSIMTALYQGKHRRSVCVCRAKRCAENKKAS